MKENAPRPLPIQMLSILLPIGVFCLLLIVPLPESFLRFQGQFQLAHLLALIFLFYLSFRVPGRAGWVAGCTLAAALFALQLASKWSLGISNANIIGGFIPYKDGFYYLNGARMLLAGQSITGEGLQGAFRPLYPGLLSVLLLLTRGNLLWVLAAVMLLVSVSIFSAARALGRGFGPLPAALLMALQYAFIRPMIGFSLTELPSLLFSALAFILLLGAADSKKSTHIALGSLMLVIAISVRAGPFFTLPFLILWVGWVFRAAKKIAVKKMVVFGLLFAAEFLAVNMLFPRLTTSAGSSTFGNFSWMLYGQAVGGAGWSYHLQALGTHDSAVVMQAALEKIRSYPLGLVIGAFKSYRDFFLPGPNSMFNLIFYRYDWANYLFWAANMILLAAGILRTVRRVREPRYALLLCCFLGTLLSIPFLPPVDGGSRFYSGIVPFFFALEAVGLAALLSAMNLKNAPGQTHAPDHPSWLRALSGGLAALTLIAPIGVKLASRPPVVPVPDCLGDQLPFAVQLYPGSYVDIIPPGGSECGDFPRLCLADFEKNGVDKNNDDFFQELVRLSAASAGGIRVSAALDLLSLKYHFNVIPLETIAQSGAGPLYAGCAQQIKTQYQTIYLVKSVLK